MTIFPLAVWSSSNDVRSTLPPRFQVEAQCAYRAVGGIHVSDVVAAGDSGVSQDDNTSLGCI